MIGADGKYEPGDIDLDPFELTRSLLDQLPPDLARKVGFENALRVYRLNQPLICHQLGTDAARAMRVDARALGTNLGHGDVIGPCR